ncbi:MAG: hypothetical protein ACLTW7_15210 [Enterococcus sp.]
MAEGILLPGIDGVEAGTVVILAEEMLLKMQQTWLLELAVT